MSEVQTYLFVPLESCAPSNLSAWIESRSSYIDCWERWEKHKDDQVETQIRLRQLARINFPHLEIPTKKSGTSVQKLGPAAQREEQALRDHGPCKFDARTRAHIQIEFLG